ncbi:MAG: LacI family DNA-binding transcriptional regulator, partial [Clostridia bacterium]|nr:LacI family DNA-binding transcriptional regulator [Clostridia bacterium]
MTMRELAKIAGVSVSTVSKVFSDAPDVGEETKKKIIGLARENGCFSKYNKEKYPKKTVAIICPEYESVYYMSYVIKLQSIIEKHGGIAVVLSYHFNFRLQRDLIDYCASYLKVDGIINLCLKEPLRKEYDLPIVNLFSQCDRNLDEITEDHADAIGEAVRALYERGHRNIAYVG